MLTDGEVSDATAIIRWANENAQHMRMFTVGHPSPFPSPSIASSLVSDVCLSTLLILHSPSLLPWQLGVGRGSSQHLVRGLARATSGSCVFLDEAAEIPAKVMTLLDRAMQPCITNVQVDWTPLQKYLTPGHPHPLVPTSNPYAGQAGITGFNCDRCHQTFAFGAGHVANHCAPCGYDECSACAASHGQAPGTGCIRDALSHSETESLVHQR